MGIFPKFWFNCEIVSKNYRKNSEEIFLPYLYKKCIRINDVKTNGLSFIHKLFKNCSNIKINL
ncbi:hypothetical protein BpHYR1_009022 [Brachionus plicatilis]|uniref:Uncharacterized protein n=1 Tax=Brachionus plicatilis TaxID=10195 RepID=A0A3M7QE81_BRAPC|nr:hypothetical protein BpHYR1_009022 [Brachionus plicatilis]